MAQTGQPSRLDVTFGGAIPKGWQGRPTEELTEGMAVQIVPNATAKGLPVLRFGGRQKDGRVVYIEVTYRNFLQLVDIARGLHGEPERGDDMAYFGTVTPR